MFNKNNESEYSYCQMEIISAVTYLAAMVWGLAMLYRSALLSEIARERVIDSLLSVVSLMFILLLHKFRDNLCSNTGKKYCCMVHAFLYFCAIIQGDKYTICLLLIIYLSNILYQPNLDYIIRGMLGFVVLLECASLWFLMQELSENNIIDKILMSCLIDIAFIIVLIIYLVKDKLDSILNWLINSALYRILLPVLMIAIALSCSWMMQKAGQWEYLALIAQEHPRKIVFILMLATVYMLRPWMLRKTISIRMFNKYCICAVLCAGVGVICIGLSYWEKTFATQYAFANGYSCQYNLDDYNNGNIELQSFELEEDGTLISQCEDPWMIVKRKDGYNRTIYNIVFEFEQLTNEGESNIYFVFDDENDWDAGSQTGSYICERGRVVIEGEQLKSIQNYIRFDLAQQEGVEIRLSQIIFNDSSDNIGGIQYIGISFGVLAVIFAGYVIIQKTGRYKKKNINVVKEEL